MQQQQLLQVQSRQTLNYFPEPLATWQTPSMEETSQFLKPRITQINHHLHFASSEPKQITFYFNTSQSICLIAMTNISSIEFPTMLLACSVPCVCALCHMNTVFLTVHYLKNIKSWSFGVVTLCSDAMRKAA